MPPPSLSPPPLSVSPLSQILYGSLDNLTHLHLETARRGAGLAAEVDVALAVLLEDRYDAFRAAVAAHEKAVRAAAAARLWGPGPGAGGEGLHDSSAALAGRAGRPQAGGAPPGPPHPPSPLAGLSPEGRAAAVADRLAGLGGAVGALLASTWALEAVAATAAGRCDGQPVAVRALLAPPPGSVCEAWPGEEGEGEGEAGTAASGPLWRRLAWAAGALRGGRGAQGAP